MTSSSPDFASSSRPARRLSASRIEDLRAVLPLPEREVLGMLATVQIASTTQIARVVFGGAADVSAGPLARRHLGRLARSGLVRRFVDRSRDRKVGAPGHVHTLTPAGLKIAAAEPGIAVRQRKAYRPSERFLTHRLAISELFVRLREQEQRGGAVLREFVAEPGCWRTYGGPAGETRVLKPDALVRLGVGQLELSWFVEVDLDGERPAVITGKCDSYRAYEASGEEQRRYDVFPSVMFIVPTPARAASIRRVISRQPTGARELFVVAVEEDALTALAEVTS